MKWPTYSMHTFVGGFNQILYLLWFHMTKHGNFGFDTFCYWGLATTHNLKEWIYYQLKVIHVTRSTQKNF